MSTVSILTVTQYSRRNHLLKLIEMIKKQDYQHIQQWTIVNGSINKKYANKCKRFILKHCRLNIPINYIEWKKDRTFADMINIGNTHCTGNYISQMEDDEFYFSTHISHAVYTLNNSSYQIAGCSSVYIWNSLTNELFRNRGFVNHSGNHALVYSNEYLNTHKYSGISFSIEPTFTNNWTEPLIQLNPTKSVIHILHCNNTINWKSIIDKWNIYSIDIDSLSDIDEFRLFIKNYHTNNL